MLLHQAKTTGNDKKYLESILVVSSNISEDGKL